jgi:hypothetical protein
MSKSDKNKQARRYIAQISEKHNITSCEIRLNGCLNTFGIAPAHRHKRRWYLDKPDFYLWNLNQWVAACQYCHNKIEHDSDLTKEVFNRLRGIDEVI